MGWPRRLRELVDPPEHQLVPAPRRHWQMLWVAATVVVSAFVLDVIPGERVALHGLHQFPAPRLCLSQALFGHDCPGCGLTRSLVYLARGDWHSSLRMHRLGWLMALAIVTQFPYRVLCLARRDRQVVPKPVPKLIGWLLIAALIVNWVAGLVVAAATGV